MESSSMFFFRRKRQHEETAKDIKKDIDKQFSKARQSIAKNRKELTKNGIILEIKSGLGGHHV